VLDQVMREIQIQVLPADIPERIVVDVTSLIIGRSLHVRDVKVERATILSDPDATVCTVVAPRAEEVAPVAGAEGAATVAEPELIRKPKPDEEGEGEEEGEAKPEAKKEAKAEAKPKGEAKESKKG
jgi:large subunit ribosomal protein L25